MPTASNTNLTSDIILKEALTIMKNAQGMIPSVDRQYDAQFAAGGASIAGPIGPSLRIRFPARYVATEGETMVEQDSVDTAVTLTVSTAMHVGMNFGSNELTQSIQNFSKNYIAPAMSTLIDAVDRKLASTYVNAYNSVGTPGVSPATTAVCNQAGSMLTKYCALNDQNRMAVVNPDARATLIGAFSTLYNAPAAITSQFETGVLAKSWGFEWRESNCINSHTNGAVDATSSSPCVQVNGPDQSGSTIAIDKLAALAVLKAGDVFQLAGVYGANPVSGQNLGHLQHFSVTADTTASGGGAIAALPIAPSIVTSGAYKTVTNSPANDASVVFLGVGGGVYPQNLCFSRSAITLATADIELPEVKFRSRNNMDGISLRIVKDYTIATNKNPCRIDILFGVKMVRPEWCTRMYG